MTTKKLIDVHKIIAALKLNKLRGSKEPIEHDSLKIEGIVEIINGDTHIIAKNKFVQNSLIFITNMIAAAATSGAYNLGSGSSGTAWKMYLGIDTATATTYNMTALQSSIGVSPGTVPNTISGSTSNPSNGVFKVVFTATWNAGTVSGTVGEMALYLYMQTSLAAFAGTLTQGNQVTAMASRLAVADGAFSSFAINTSNPLTINWTIQFSF